MIDREIATIGFSPYNRVLEAVDANVTLYESEEELVYGMEFRLKHGFSLPDVIIASAGVDKPCYDEVIAYLSSLNIKVPVIVYDQAHNIKRKSDAAKLGAFEYVADPIEDDLFESKIEAALDEVTSDYFFALANTPPRK